MSKNNKLTEKQERCLNLQKNLKSTRKVAIELGISNRTVRDHLKACEEKGFDWRAPVEVPNDWNVTNTTVQYNGDGEVIQEWRRLSPEFKNIEKFVDRLCGRVEGKSTLKFKDKKYNNKDLLHEIVISDVHLGMLAQKAITGESNYDSKLAKNLIIKAVYNLANRADAEEILLVFNGDNLHADNRDQKTEKSGHRLDVDTRYQKTIEVMEAAIVESVKICSERCNKIKLLIMQGNHDWHSSFCVRRIMEAYYRNVDEVEVLNPHNPRNVCVWGENLIGHAHGDCIKATDWAKIIPTQFKHEWAQTTYRYLHLGHIHTSKSFSPVEVDSQVGLVVEYLRALCPADSWHTNYGYVGQVRGAESFLYHKKYGLDARWSFNSDNMK